MEKRCAFYVYNLEIKLLQMEYLDWNQEIQDQVLGLFLQNFLFSKLSLWSFLQQK